MLLRLLLMHLEAMHLVLDHLLLLGQKVNSLFDGRVDDCGLVNELLLFLLDL